MYYLLCLNESYNIKVGEDTRETIDNLEMMLDNMVNLIRSYGLDDEEILDAIKDDTSIEIEEV